MKRRCWDIRGLSRLNFPFSSHCGSDFLDRGISSRQYRTSAQFFFSDCLCLACVQDFSQARYAFRNSMDILLPALVKPDLPVLGPDFFDRDDSIVLYSCGYSLRA
jgi:hypothetical protein